MKVYAKQINPEYQESYLFDDDGMGTEYINVCGNKDFQSRTSKLFDRVKECLDNGELAEAIEDIKTGGYYSSFYENVTQAINDLLWREDGKPYGTRQIGKLKQLVLKYSDCRSNEEDQILVDVLSIVKEEKWDYRQINGCCQSDWNYVYYPVQYWTKEGLDAFETMYFNTGSEWVIHDEETEPESPEDISGYSVYCISWNDEGIKKELAEAAGVEPEEIIMYAYDHSVSVPVYRIA